MRSVFLGKNAAHWLISNIEHIVVGVSPKQFFTFREGDTTFTLQWSSNSSGQFLLLTELKTGRSRRSIIILEGKERYGWKDFGLERRKVLNPSQYAVGENGPKFIPQVQRFNLEAHHSRTFVEVVQDFHGRTEDKKKPKHLGISVKGKITHKGEEKMGEKLRITGTKIGVLPVRISEKMEGMGGAGRESCRHEVAEGCEQILADPRIRVPSISLNSKVQDKRKKSDVGSSGWSGRSLVVEVDVTGRRRVSWERKRRDGTWLSDVPRAAGRERATELPKSLIWVSKGLKRAVKPFVGLGTSPDSIDPSVGLLKSVFSSPSTFEVGEGSLAGVGGPAQASMMVGPGSGDTAWSTGFSEEADETSAAGSSSGEPSAPSGETDSPSLASSSDELLSHLGKADGPCDASTCSVEVVASLGKAGDPSAAGISSIESPISLGKSGDLSSAGTSSGELMVVSGKADLVFSRPLVEYFLSTLLLSFLKARLVVLGDQEGDNGGLVSLTALDSEQSKLAESPTKAVCAVSGASVLGEEEWSVSDKGLGGEDSSPVPLMAINPSGLQLSAELKGGNEAVGCENILDTSRWVQNKLPGFSKLVGLPLNRHERLCIALLQKIEKETEAAKAMNRKVTLSKKALSYKDKGKRELRNLQSSVNYDNR